MRLNGILLWLLVVPAVAAQTMESWTQQSPADRPFSRSFHSMAYDFGHSQVVLFGGLGGRMNNVFGDTWLWNGSNWTQAFPQASPLPRLAAAMSNLGQGEIVLFGGIGCALDCSDTWVWDGFNWTQESPPISPSARHGHAMAYDFADSETVLFGGETSLTYIQNSQTWVWDGSNWTQKSPQTNPPARSYTAMAFDAANGHLVMFGGQFGSNSGGYAAVQYLGDTWVWDGSNWSQKFPVASPPARSQHAMAWDAVSGKVVLFGGVGAAGTLNDTWVWDGANWTQESPQIAPLARVGHAMTVNAGGIQVVLFGGYGYASGVALDFADMWIWSGGPGAPVITAVVNGASFVGGGVVPGEIATLFGVNLGSFPNTMTSYAPTLPTFWFSESVVFSNQLMEQPAPLMALENLPNGQQQINFQVPWEAASGSTANITVTNNGAAVASISVPVLAAQPGIFTYSAGGEIFGAILHANYQLADTANPAKGGESVLIFCTGLGRVSSPTTDGFPAESDSTISTPVVTIGGLPATVDYSGLAPDFSGLYQINAEVPMGLTAGTQPVVVTLLGASSNSVLLPVE